MPPATGPSARESRREEAENTLCAAELAVICGRDDQAPPLLDAAAAAFVALEMPAQHARAQALQRA